MREGAVFAIMIIVLTIALGALVYSASKGAVSSTSVGGQQVKIDSIEVNETSSVFVNLLLQTQPSSVEVNGGQHFKFNLTVGFFRTLDEGVIYTNATAIKGNLSILTSGFILDHVYQVGTHIDSDQIIVAGDTTVTVTVEMTAPNSAYQGRLSLLLNVAPYIS
jgi:hypothetical protein